MSLNIKAPEAHTLATALAKATGETMTQAVAQALQERLDRVRRRAKPEATAAELLAIGRRCASTLTSRPNDHARLLYDKHGIPK